MVSALIAGWAALAVASALLCLLLVPLARRLALRMGLVDRPGERKIHAQAIPYGGGIAIFFTVLIVLAGAYSLLVSSWSLPGLAALRAELAAHLSGLQDLETLKRLGALLVGGAMVFVLGLADDLRGFNPWFKLAIQAAAGLLLFAVDIRVTLFVSHWLPSLLLTLFWMVLMTNAMNLLDNMDGLSAGVGAVASAIFFIIAVQAEQIFVASLLAVLFGALLGFLVYNFHPATLFMGDAGALFLGYMLGAVAMAGTYYHGTQGALSVVMPLIVLAIPLFDTTSVMLIRWRLGTPLMQGDKNHFSHRLVRLGMTQREAVLTIYILTATLGASAMLLAQLDNTAGVLVLVHTLGVLVVIGLLEHAAHRRRP